MKRQVAALFVNEQQLSIQRTCRKLGLSRTAYHRAPTDAAAHDAAVITVLNEIVAGIAGAWQRIGELGVKPGEMT